jgi:hypothetical protein
VYYRPRELLKILRSDENKSELAITAEQETALLQWAYFEACSFVNQYADLIDNLRSYLRTGTSTVGECALLIEQDLVD